MNDNIDLLKTEVDKIKKSLNELKDNITFSETEKKDQAEILNKQAEVTKQKIQKEIDFLANKTDEESKRKKEEAEALLISCNDITALYNSIINPSTSSTTQSPSQSPTESTNIFTKAKDWIKNQRNSILDRGKWKTEWWKNLLRAAWGATSIVLLYKWAKKLWNWAFWDNEKEDNNENYESKENTSENDEEKTEVRTNEETNEEENNNNDNYAETTEGNTKEEKKESIWSKLWWKALAWLWIAPAAWTAAAAWAATAWATDKESDSWTSEDVGKDESTSNEPDKENSSDPSTNTNEPENSPDKKESNENTTKKDTKNSTNSNESKEVDKGKNTYTNPISGLTYKRIDQVTDPAGKLRYSWKRSGKTVANIWCLLASGCTVTSALCPEVTLTDCFNNVRHWTADKAVAKMSNNKWKSEALLSWEHGNRTKTQEQKAKEKIIENLKKWYPAVIGARHSGIDGINNSIVSQHYRAILGIRTENGKNEFFVWNTYKNGSWGWMDEDKIFKNMIHASIFTPNQA